MLLLPQSSQRCPTEAVTSPRRVNRHHRLCGNNGGIISLNNHHPFVTEGNEENFARCDLRLVQCAKEGKGFPLIEKKIIGRCHDLPDNSRVLLDKDEVSPGRQLPCPTLATRLQKGQLPRRVAQGGDVNERIAAQVGRQQVRCKLGHDTKFCLAIFGAPFGIGDLKVGQIGWGNGGTMPGGQPVGQRLQGWGARLRPWSE